MVAAAARVGGGKGGGCCDLLSTVASQRAYSVRFSALLRHCSYNERVIKWLVWVCRDLPSRGLRLPLGDLFTKKWKVTCEHCNSSSIVVRTLYFHV